MAQKKYVSLSKLSAFLDNLKKIFAKVEHSHTVSDVTDLQAALDGKQNIITGAASTITSSDLTGNRVLVTSESGKVEISDITSTELEYLSGITSSVQTQLNNKVNSDELSNYYTKTEIDDSKLITTDDIDTICGRTIQIASEVTF